MKSIKKLDELFNKARADNSKLGRLSMILQWVIPFNRPHRIRVSSIGDDHLEATLPYRRFNLNHLKGIHACATATLAEYCSGLFLLQKAGASTYRLIMKRIEVEYHRQAKSGIVARFEMGEEEFKTRFTDVLSKEGVVMEILEIPVQDEDGEHVATAKVHWQLKEWGKAKMKVG